VCQQYKTSIYTVFKLANSAVGKNQKKQKSSASLLSNSCKKMIILYFRQVSGVDSCFTNTVLIMIKTSWLNYKVAFTQFWDFQTLIVDSWFPGIKLLCGVTIKGDPLPPSPRHSLSHIFGPPPLLRAWHHLWNGPREHNIFVKHISQVYIRAYSISVISNK